MWPIQGCSFWHILCSLLISRMKLNSNPLCFSLLSSVGIICNCREEKKMSTERKSLEQEQWCCFGEQLKPNAWGYCSLEKKAWNRLGDLSEKISISTASLGLVLVITYTRKVMCFMLSFQVFAFIMQHPERWAGWTRVKREREQNDSIHLLVNKVVVNLGCESPSRELWWSPGLRQGGCGSLPRVTLREPRGRSWSFLFQLPWQALNRQTGRKNCPAFKCGKSPVSQSVSEGSS